MTPYQEHVAKWSNCTLCPLHETRTKVALVRGKLPADILYIGEAPGPSEDILGSCFVGPAGDLLQQVIDEVIGDSLRYALTNLIACIPMDEENKKFTEPPDYAVTACRPRLVEIIQIAKPRLIFLVGKSAEKYAPSQSEYGKLPPIKKMLAKHTNYTLAECDWLKPQDNGLVHYEKIVHPAAIIRADLSQQGLQLQRMKVTIHDAVQEIFFR